MRACLGLLLLVAGLVGCYESRPLEGCIHEGRYRRNGEIWDRRVASDGMGGSHTFCQDGEVFVSIISSDGPAEHGDAGPDAN